MNVVSTALNLAVIHTKTPRLRPNAWVSFVFTALAVVQISLMAYLVTGEFRCVPAGLDLVAALDLDKKDSNDLTGWVGLTCATDAKTRAWPIFLVKAGGLFTSFLVILWLADWMANFNRWDVLLRRQQGDARFASLLGKGPIDPRIPLAEYRERFRRGLRHFVVTKLVAIVGLAVFIGGALALEYAYPPVRQLLEPIDIECDEHLHWTDDRAREFDCRYKSEFSIFVLWILSQALDGLLLLLTIGSVFADVSLLRNLDTEFPLKDAEREIQMVDLP